MGLGIYREVSAGVYSIYKVDGASDSLLPITTTHDGVLGEVVEVKLFIRNNNASEYYTDIELEPVSKTVPSDVIGTATGHGVKMRAGNTQPTEAEWDAIDYATTLSFSDIGSSGSADTNTYLPFWYRIECPAGAPADNKENVVLRLYYTANVA